MIDLTYAIFRGATPMLAVLPALVGLFVFKKLPTYLKALALIFILLFLRDFVQLLIIHSGEKNTVWVSNFHVVIELIPIAILCHGLGFVNIKLKKVCFSILIICSILIITNTFFVQFLDFESKYNYKYFAFATSNLMIMIMSLIYLYDFANFSNLDLAGIPDTVILALVFCIYYSLTVGIPIVDSEVPKHIAKLIWIWRSILYISYCLAATYLFLKNIKYRYV